MTTQRMSEKCFVLNFVPDFKCYKTIKIEHSIIDHYTSVIFFARSYFHLTFINYMYVITVRKRFFGRTIYAINSLRIPSKRSEKSIVTNGILVDFHLCANVFLRAENQTSHRECKLFLLKELFS